MNDNTDLDIVNIHFYIYPRIVLNIRCKLSKIFCLQKGNYFLRHYEAVANFLTLFAFCLPQV